MLFTLLLMIKLPELGFLLHNDVLFLEFLIEIKSVSESTSKISLSQLKKPLGKAFKISWANVCLPLQMFKR